MINIKKYLRELQDSKPMDELRLGMQDMIVSYLEANPGIGLEELIDKLEKLGYTRLLVVDTILSLLSELIRGVGKHRDQIDDYFNPMELKLGIEVEKEHTDNPLIAKEIAKDHLAECPNYYTRLKKMEIECKR